VPTYEYATLFFHWESNWTQISHLPDAVSRHKSTRRWEIWLPGADECERLDGDQRLHHVLNKLGAQGWKLMDATVLNTVIVGDAGWGEVGSPAVQRWTFMRERRSE
jgi:hypothetical protein